MAQATRGPVTALLAGLFLCLGCATLFAQDWPQFRGPNGNGQTEVKGLPLTWSESENVRWKTPLPGAGHSSPVIAGTQIWVTSAIETPLTKEEKAARLKGVPSANSLDLAGRLSLRAICVDAESGKLVHDIELFVIDQPPPIHSLNSYASPTPVIENGKLYCHFGTLGTACVNTTTGAIDWKNDELKTDHQNGPGSSPIVWRDLLVLTLDGIDTQYTAALNKHTGTVVWKAGRSGKLEEKVDMKKAYCTPTVVEVGGQPIMISPGADWVYGYDPASGSELWRIKYGKLGFSTVPKPVVGNGMAYICTSYMESRLLAIKYDGQGDVTQTHVAWTFDKQVPKKPSLLLLGKELYLFSDGGVASCLDAINGAEIWKKRIDGQYSASPLYADGRIYISNQEGKTFVLQPGREFKELAANSLDAGCMASPAVYGKSLILRTETSLYRIEAK